MHADAASPVAEHVPLPYQARAVPGMQLIALAQATKMYPFGYIHTGAARHTALTRQELATALFVTGACNAFYPLSAALEGVAALHRGPAHALAPDLARSVRAALALSRQAGPDAIAAVLEQAEPLPHLPSKPDRPATAQQRLLVRAAACLTEGWEAGRAPTDTNRRQQILALQNDLLRLAEAHAPGGCACGAGTAASAAPVPEASALAGADGEAALTLDVHLRLRYAPADVDSAELVAMAHRAVERELGNGAFTGDTQATIDSWTCTVQPIPCRAGQEQA